MDSRKIDTPQKTMSVAERFARRIDEQILAELMRGEPPRPTAPVYPSGRQDLSGYVATLEPTVRRR